MSIGEEVSIVCGEDFAVLAAVLLAVLAFVCGVNGGKTSDEIDLFGDWMKFG